MNSLQRSRKFQFLILAMCLALMAGCARDPNIRKQKYLASGNSYFDQGKYREASIQYLNAIQIDKSFADAHYRLAQAYSRQGIWAGAYQELLQTTDLQPDNLKAQIELEHSCFRPSGSRRRKIGLKMCSAAILIMSMGISCSPIRMPRWRTLGNLCGRCRRSLTSLQISRASI